MNSFYFVFSLGATLAVFAVVLLIGLWGNEFGQLVNVLCRCSRSRSDCSF